MRALRVLPSVERSRTIRRFPGFRDYGTIYESRGTITKRYGRSVLATLLPHVPVLCWIIWMLHWSGMCFCVPCPRNLWISRSGTSKDQSSRIFIPFTRTLKRVLENSYFRKRFTNRCIFPMLERRLDKDFSVFDICRLINFDIELHTVLWKDYSRDRRD